MQQAERGSTLLLTLEERQREHRAGKERARGPDRDVPQPGLRQASLVPEPVLLNVSPDRLLLSSHTRACSHGHDHHPKRHTASHAVGLFTRIRLECAPFTASLVLRRPLGRSRGRCSGARTIRALNTMCSSRRKKDRALGEVFSCPLALSGKMRVLNKLSQ